MGRWINASLNDIGALTNSRVHPYKRTKPYLATLDVNGNSISPSEEVFYNSRPSRADIEIRTGDVLQAKMKATNKACFVSDDMDGWVVSTGFAQFRPETAQTEPRYFYYIISNEDFLITKDRYCVGSTQQAISDRDLKNIIVRYITSIKHQQKITAILTTIDTAIEKTESLIEKYRKIKTGLMNDLFTRGIGPDGKLRPPRSQAPELYKKTELGWIPKEWSWDYLYNLLAQVPSNMRSGPFGSALLKSELVENGIPFLGIDNVFKEYFKPEYKRFVSEKKYSELIRYAVKPKDVTITIMGTVGRCAVIPDNIGRALSSKHLWTMTFNDDKYIPELICWQLNYAPWVISWFRRETQGGIMDAIQSKTLKEVKLPLPKIEEQKEILKRATAINMKIEDEDQYLTKLQKQKAGLMQDLLTGKVEVTVPEEEAVRG